MITWLDSGNLESYAGDIAGWQDSLRPGADLLFYGCDLAAGEDGRILLDNLSRLTNADVAASDDLTGTELLGGDWDLEYTRGTVETGLDQGTLMQARWMGLLGQITVTTTADTLDGDANTNNLADLAANPGADGEISLREAIKAANNDPDADTIFLQAGTYTITRSGFDDDSGDYDIREDLSIVGVSPSATVIDGANSSTVFDVHDDAAISVSISNLKIEDGLALVLGEEKGAGLNIKGALNTPDVYIDNLWFSGNISNWSGSGTGGAIANAGNLTITNTLIEGNGADKGGGIWNSAFGALTMENVTVSGNNATGGDGGGIWSEGIGTLRNVTVTANDADDPSASDGNGGGIFLKAGSTLDVGNSIIAGNTAEGGKNDVRGDFTSSGSNIIQDPTSSTGFAAPETGIDPLLGGLSNNGGDLMTHAPGAPAIDAADPTMAPATDQRGFLRDDGSPDIGAFEVGANITPVSADLWLSTEDVVAGGGQSGNDNWNPSDLIGIADPQLNLGPGTTSGTFSTVFDADGFSIGWDMNAAHYVTADIQIGSSNFQLLAGDLLISPKYNGTIFTSNNLVALDTGFQASVTANNADLVVFRPDNYGDYSKGQFAMLLEDVAGGNWLQGITLIERNITVGGYALQAGDFLYSRSGPSGNQSVWLYESGTTGAGATPVSRQEFLDGDEAGVGIGNAIHGLELLETTTEVGGHVLEAGTLLVNVDVAEPVGSNGLNVESFDVFALNITTSTLVGAGQVTAQMLFDGSHVAFDSSEEDMDALAVVPRATTITATNLSPVMDTYISIDNPNDNYGANTTLKMDESGPGLGDGHVLLQFDLSSISAGATITSAVLQMEATAGADSSVINVYDVTEAWDEGSGGSNNDATWNERQTGTFWTTSGGTVGTAVASLTTSSIGTHSWNITGLVQDWLSGTKTNNGLMLAGVDTGTVVFDYDSSEGGYAAAADCDLQRWHLGPPVLALDVHDWQRRSQRCAGIECVGKR